MSIFSPDRKVEPVVENKKRKRIRMVEDSSDDDLEDKTFTPNKKQKSSLFNVSTNSTPKSSLKSTPKMTPTSSKKSEKTEKENITPPTTTPRSSNLKQRLSNFASPSLNKSKTEEKMADENEGYNPNSSFPHISDKKYNFLKPEKITDKEGRQVSLYLVILMILQNFIFPALLRRPSDEDYDPTTLYVPMSFLDDQTPARRQW